MKIWVLKRLIPDEYGEVHYQFIAVFRSVEGAKNRVEAMEKDNMEGWKDVGYGWLKKSHVVRGYWEIDYSYLND